MDGIVVKGHQVASGNSACSPFPAGTLEIQIPIFAELGLVLKNTYKGTLNVSVAPFMYKIVKPEVTFTNVKWIDAHPAESFSFLRCYILFRDLLYPSWLYHPHPETKTMHHQAPTTLEIITEYIAGISYGSKLTLYFDEGSIYFSEQKDV